MAMTKKETAYVKELETELKLLNAWHRTQPIEPDIMLIDLEKEPENTFSSGYYINNNRFEITVHKAITNTFKHYLGSHTPPASAIWSQHGINLYSSKILALKAKRYFLERQFMEELKKIDDEILIESQKEKELLNEK